MRGAGCSTRAATASTMTLAFLLSHFYYLPLEVDCMSEKEFKKCERYFYRFPDKFAEGRNFFAQSLNSHTIYYCFPPPSLIHPTILHFLKFGCKGLLLVPLWPSSSYWTLIAPDGVHLGQWCVSVLRFQPSGFLVCPAVTSTTFKEGRMEMLGIHFDFFNLSVEDLSKPRRSRSNCLEGGCSLCR